MTSSPFRSKGFLRRAFLALTLSLVAYALIVAPASPSHAEETAIELRVAQASGGETPKAEAAGAPSEQPAAKLEANDGDAKADEPAEDEDKKGFLEKMLPIFILLAVIGLVLARLPKIDLGHSDAYRRRRVMNWLPLGLTYMLLYMGRYNLTVSKKAFADLGEGAEQALMTNEDFGIIFAVGTVVYGASFLINGPLTDRYGGKFSILMGAAGSAVANIAMGVFAMALATGEGAMAEFAANNFVPLYSVLYGLNMYFQSFGAVAIVKCNAPWFHVRERGVFGAIFGILISLGIYLAFDVGYMIVNAFSVEWVFFIPAGLLVVLWVVDLGLVKNTPGEAGHDDFDTADASSGDDGPRLGAIKVFKMMLSNPIIMTIAAVEFCSGFLRQAIMQWYRAFAEQTDGALGFEGSFVYENWGLLLCCAGIMGGVFAGVISDRVFQSRRGPVAAVLYAMMLLGAVIMAFTFQLPMVGWLIIFMSMAVIGVHGMLSGTASMDFGGKKNVGIAVGIIDGFVYLGTAVMAGTYAILLPEEQTDAAGNLVGPATDPDNWLAWPVAMIPLSLLGLVLAIRLWNAKPKGKGKGKDKGAAAH